MDLKDVVAIAAHTATEAGLAFHAGHHDDSEKLLMELMVGLGKYFDEKTKPAGDVTESATSETPAGPPEEKPAEVPGAYLHPAAHAADVAAQKKALDQAGP